MLTITITTRPDRGALDRECRICGENYHGWNFVACPMCEMTMGGRVTIVEAWRSEPITRVMGR